MPAYVYILASKPNGTLYVGITTDLAKRISEHKDGITGGFTAKYNVHRLVYYEAHDDMEKSVKRWLRKWKLELIEKMNPEWRDLFEELTA